MKILKCVFGIVLVFMLVVPYLHAQGNSATLRDEVREKGAVWLISYPEALFLLTLDQMVSQSEIIFRGRVINEKTRLPADEDYVLTEYTIEVSEVYLDSLQAATLGKTLVITKSYDVKKFRAKQLVRKVEHTRRYEATPEGVRALAGLLILRDKVIKPLLAAACQSQRRHRTLNPTAIDQHYESLRHTMLSLFQELGIAA